MSARITLPACKVPKYIALWRNDGKDDLVRVRHTKGCDVEP